MNETERAAQLFLELSSVLAKESNYETRMAAIELLATMTRFNYQQQVASSLIQQSLNGNRMDA